MPTELAGLIPNMDEHTYHSRPELSSTGARMLLPEYKGSPRKFQWAQSHRRESRAYDVGHAAHSKILGVGAGTITYPGEHLTPGGNPSTKAATVAWEQEQRSNGLVPIAAVDARRVDGMAEAVLADPDARSVLETVTGREVSLFTDVDGVPTRARFDIYGEGEGADLKTAVDASPDGFNHAVDKFGLHVQEAWYRAAHRAITGVELDRFRFLVVEKTAPYWVAVYDLDENWRDIGQDLAAKAREIWSECTNLNDWPGYESGTLACPPYVIARHDARYEEEIRI